MTDTNQYIIDQQLLQDIKCQHNDKKKTYNKYCIECKKNICFWCKGHKNHETIDYESIEPDQEKYEEVKNSMLNMKSIKEKIEEKTLKISQLKEFVDELMNFISEANEKIKTIENIFNSHLKYNEIIFNAYKEDIKNYYILTRFNSLDFNFENDFLKNDSTFKKLEYYINNIKGINIDRNITGDNKFNIINQTNERYENEENNMWISEKYCNNWGIREAIREFLQNQFDGIIIKIESKKNLIVKKVGDEYTINGKKQYLEYDFMKKNEDKIYGKIRYNNNKKELTISNEGELCLADFLLGGSKEELNNPDIIGIFGEGMKLAILALCRLEKNVTIISSEKLYSFRIKEDLNFIKNSQPQKCLHCRIERNNNSNMKNEVTVIIENINENEWGNEINNYLWLLGKDIDIFTASDNNNKELGQILFEDYLKCKIYSKGIFVQDTEFGKKDKNDKENIPGFNANLKLDRDRNCIQNQSELKTMVSKIIVGTFNKNTDYLRDRQLHTGNTFIRTEYGFKKSNGIGFGGNNSGLSKLTQIVIDCLQKEKDIINYSDLGYGLSKESIEIIWNEFDLKPENKNKQPTHSAGYIDDFIFKKKLPKDFYLYYEVSYNLLYVLKRCSFYKSLEDKFKEYAMNTANEEPNKEYQVALNEVYSKIKNINENFSENHIKFKKFSKIDEDLCFKNEKDIYFSSAKLKENINIEWKFWIFIKILTILNVKIEKSYSIFFEIFKKPIIQNSNTLQIIIKDNILQIEE